MTTTYLQTKFGEFAVHENENSVTTTLLTPDSSDYTAYLAWLSEGNTPLPAPEPEPAPPAPPAPLTPAEKLAAAGLTVEELKALLKT